ncbi:p450 domain-containing protein [Cephalotus follicularis]|uniref:p450 domain-containing protein n=1 Tax=Cephalotus follicularis TaxID=3775 RepID=A0A1Q3ASZ1_CEPFO|nr:p450 domain-containing protein [Cephalotus follicularis]
MEEATIFFSFVSLLLLLLAFKLLTSNARYKNTPPSPPSLPIFGHLHLLKQPLHRTFHKLFLKYGPIISLRFGSRHIIVASSPSIVEECFTKNDVVLANRPMLLIGKHVGYNNTTIGNAPYGDHWRNLRRIAATELLSTHRLNMLVGIRREEIKRLLRRLSRDSCNEFAKVELKSLFSELTFNIMMRMVAGKRYYGEDVTDEEEARKFREMMSEIQLYGGVSHPGDFLPILNWIDHGGFEKRLVKLGKKVDAFLQGLINERRSKNEDLERKNTMIDHLNSLQESESEYYTDQTIKGIILAMLFAGTETSSVTLEWAMSNLVNHPDILNKARAELDTHVGEERLVDEPDVSKLPYLQNIISETLRLYPAAPLLLPHMSYEDCKIGGYDVPRDTILLVNAWAIHRDPNLWDDPESFKPERFESGQVEAHKWVPFGLGRRACPGAGLAQRVVGLTLGLLIQSFEWERVSEKLVDMTEGKGLTMPKAVPLEAMSKVRPVMNNKFLCEDVYNSKE